MTPAPAPARRLAGGPTPPAIQLWFLDEAALASRDATLAASLSPAERARAEALRGAAAQRRFLRFRGALRLLLGHALGQAPAAVALAEAPGGKPQVLQPGSKPLEFSLAHCEGLLAVALGRAGPLGVDLERLRPGQGPERLAARILAPAERAELARLPAAARPAALWRAWTCKEAVLKATGEGLARDPAGVCVTLDPDRPPRLLSVLGRPGAAARWRLHLVHPAPGVMLALATADPQARLCRLGAADLPDPADG